VGPNGAGKSSLMKAIAGDIAPTRGAITVDGRDMSSLGPRDAAAVRSYLSQSHASTSHFSVETIVGFGQFAQATPNPDAVRSAMDRVGVCELADRPFDELSGGEQRRVMVARVLCQDSPVVLLDEPTDSLDLGHAELVMATAADEAAAGKTVVTTSHDLNVAARHATTMVLLSEGRTVRIGMPQEVLEPAILSEVYATTVTVVRHPTSGLPVVIV
jgi:heme transport system ATP-binding protein